MTKPETYLLDVPARFRLEITVGQSPEHAPTILVTCLWRDKHLQPLSPRDVGDLQATLDKDSAAFIARWVSDAKNAGIEALGARGVEPENLIICDGNRGTVVRIS